MVHADMKVSVVIPVHNEEEYIGACLDSLISQIDPANEIIIVDNNSTDGTVKIAKKYPVRIVKEKKQGITPARNRGFNKAKYEIIARTDADTVLPPNWIKLLKKSFQDQKMVAVSGPAEFIDYPIFMKSPRWRTKTASLRLMRTYNSVVRKILKHDCLYGPNCAIRKSAWEQIKTTICLDDSQVHEDIDLAIHLSPLGKIKFNRNIIVKTSVRRWKKPEAYIEYLYRGLKSLNKHKGIKTKEKSKLLVKRIVSKASVLIHHNI